MPVSRTANPALFRAIEITLRGRRSTVVIAQSSYSDVYSSCTLRGLVNSALGFTGQTPVIHGLSDLFVDLYGVERGRHARTAFGVSELPFGLAVEVDCQVAIGRAT